MVIKNLAILKEPRDIILYNDSEYVARAMNAIWFRMWKEGDWRHRCRGINIAINRDFCAKLLSLNDKHNVHFKSVKGHEERTRRMNAAIILPLLQFNC